MKRSFILIGIILMATVLVACGGPEEKKAKFFKKGRVLYEKGDYVKRPLQNVPFCPISASDSDFNPRNTQCIPVVKIFIFLELEQN